MINMNSCKEPKIIKSDSSNRFVGLKVVNKQVELYLPYNYEISEEKKVYEMNVLLNCIYWARTNSKINISLEETDHFDESLPFNSFAWLIRDYIQNGLFVCKEKVTSLKKMGKVNWKKTITEKSVFLKDSIFFSEFYFDSSNRLEDVISFAQKYCLKISSNYFGWMFNNFNFEFNSFETINDDYLIREIKKRYFDFHDDHTKYLIKNIIDIIESLKTLNLKDSIGYGTNNFEYIWEAMIEDVFNNVNKEKYYPTSNWEINCKSQKNQPLRIDSIYEANDLTFIIDAKYYNVNFENFNNLPGTSDILKQIAYAESYLSNHKMTQVSNIFIIPHSKNIFSNTLMYIGSSRINWRDMKSDYEKIHIVSIDIKFLISNYRTEKENMRKMLLDLANNNEYLNFINTGIQA